MKNKVMQKWMLSLLGISIVFSLTACGKPDPGPVEVTPEVEETTEEPEAEEPAEEPAEEAKAEEPAKEEAPAAEESGDNMIDNGDFSAGTDPWMTFCQDGECGISVNGDGELDVDIKDIGTVEHGVQLYHDGFSLEEGCVYKIAFDAHADKARPIQMRFQLNGGDYHAYCMEYINIPEASEHFEFTFTMEEETDPAPRFCFNMGVVEDIDTNIGEHHVYLDNVVLSLEDDSGKVAGSGQVEMPDIAVNQIGYLPGMLKTATLRGSALNQTAKLINEDTKESVLDAAIDGGKNNPDTGDSEAVFDFTSVKEEGTYHVEAGDAVSPSFVIGTKAYEDAFKASLKMLYYQRCGVELTSDLAGDFAHKICHQEDAMLYEDNSVKLNVTGGWHDAGDYGRYTVAGAKAAADLLLAYENYPSVFDDAVGIPESGNGTPDVLDEARYELEWLLKMQADNGGVYHKVTCQNFPGEVLPEEETDPLIIMPVSTTATADFAGVMAIASRVYASVDKSFADTCLEAAKKAAAYIDETPRDTKGYKNPSDISTGEYEDVNDVDERFWAYAELYKTTGDKAYEESLKSQLPDNGYSLGWQGVAGYGGYAYLTSKDTDVATTSDVVEEANKMSLEIQNNANANAYGSSIVGDYVWGSNLTIANNGSYLLMTNDLLDSDGKAEDVKAAADKQLNYLFGNNATGYCFFTGFGTTSSAHPHHRPSQVVGKAVPGMLVGGPNNGLNDPYVQNVLKDTPSAKCYADNSQSYSTNETAIYWNSPIIYLLAGEIATTK